MRTVHVLRNTKGFAKAAASAIKWRSMRNKLEVERRVKILTFWSEYGTNATTAAFGVGRSTLFRWQHILTATGGSISSLDPKSTASHRRRVRSISPKLERAIIHLRTEYPNLGKKKLTPLLRTEGFLVSEPYIGRVLSDLKQRGRLPTRVPLSWYAKDGVHRERPKTKQKKRRRPEKRGLELDTIVRHIDGRKRYTLTAIDVTRRFAYAHTYTSHSSGSARDFLKRLIRYAPFEITEIQTDNGSEFARHFADACRSLAITHYHTYPRCPKMNAYIERFNRTLSEEFLVHYRSLLRDDVEALNDKLNTWLYWYNTKRPHEGLKLLSPIQYIRSITSRESQK